MSVGLRPVWQGLLFVGVAAVAWGTGGAAASVLYRISGLGPISVSFWRFVGAILIMAGGRWAFRRLRPGSPSLAEILRGRRLRFLITGVGMAVYQTSYFASVQLAGVALATIVTLGTGPVLIAAGARIVMGERLGRLGPVVLGASLLGLVLLVGGADRTAGQGTGPAPLAGVGFGLLSATGYASVTLMTRAAGQGGEGGSTETALAAFVIGAVCLLPLAPLEGLLPRPTALAATLGLLAFLSAVPSALAYALFFAGLGSVRAATAAVVCLVEPVTAALIAFLLLGERLTPVAAAGGAVLLGAVLLLALRERRAGAQSVPAAAANEPQDPLRPR